MQLFNENLYSPHTVVTYNKNSNGTKTMEKIQWQCSVNTSVMNVYYTAWSREDVNA